VNFGLLSAPRTQNDCLLLSNLNPFPRYNRPKLFNYVMFPIRYKSQPTSLSFFRDQTKVKFGILPKGF